MRIIAIGGIPAVGKTTIINNFFKYNSWWEDFKFKKVYGHINRDLSLIIVGKYGGDSIFAGTDRLSMAVHPDFKELLTLTNKYNILFEGDRLFTKSILEFCDNTANLHTIIIESNDTKSRHKKRKDNQSEKFLKGRITKINNIKNCKFNNNIRIFKNDKEDEHIQIYKSIKEILNGK